MKMSISLVKGQRLYKFSGLGVLPKMGESQGITPHYKMAFSRVDSVPVGLGDHERVLKGMQACYMNIHENYALWMY